jgi:hypothetical protein
MMSVMPVESGATMFLNAVMLFLVSIEPYLLSLLSFGSSEASKVALGNFASEAYALDVGGLTLILGVFAHQLTNEGRELVTPALIDTYRRSRNALCFVAAFFVASTLPIFWSWEIMGTPARFYLWYAALVFIWISRLSGRFKKAGS